MLGDMLMDKSFLLADLGPVRRNLFGVGPEDHAEIRKTVNQQLRFHAEINRKEWNFDFDNYLPLPGRWQWEVMRPEESTTAQAVEAAEAATAPAGSSTASTQTSPRKRLRQQHITDYFPQVKHRRLDDGDSGAPKS